MSHIFLITYEIFMAKRYSLGKIAVKNVTSYGKHDQVAHH